MMEVNDNTTLRNLQQMVDEWIKTYGVRYFNELTNMACLTEEVGELARIIALLHDIGRFEQLKRFDSFELTTMDHAAYGVQVLFEEGMIRQFVPEDTWDDIIRTAIARHSDFRLEGITLRGGNHCVWQLRCE